MRARIVLGVLIVAALVTAIVILWPGPAATDSTTTAVAAPSTTTSEPTTSTPPTTVAGSHVVETVEEAEEVLRQLWFGWFEGIYNQDEERIKEVVGSQQFLDNARASFGVAEFTGQPFLAGVTVTDLEILRSDEDCLVTWSGLDVSSFREPGVSDGGVDVLRWVDDRWVFLSAWAHRNDTWEEDCEALLEPLS